ncbi:TNT domain-containing protein [Mycobacterium sp. D16R24]|uniref:TNT domain-containing protein n=1 Tax=Mycobacterium sp. D16R24 TaxID=1855656 RepID=UPI0025711C28|nr:TNT domain-containing protein [Mycobacterium sp. D16R24]
MQKLESRTETFKSYVNKPGGTYWEGHFAEAAQQNAGDGLKTVGSIRDTVDALADQVTSTVTYGVLPPLTAAKAIINHAEQQQGVMVNDDLSMTYTPPSGMSDEAVEKSRQAVATMAKELKDNADKWWAATQTVKGQIEAGEGKVAGELNLAAATFNVNNAVAQTKSADVPGAQNGNFYKDWYPQSEAPGATTAANAAVDPNAPKLGPPSPGDKPLQADPRAGSLTGNLGALGIAEPKSPLEQPRPVDPRTTLAPKLDPNSPQGKAAIDQMRKTLHGMYPPAEAEQRLQDAIKGAQQDRPMVAVPEPGAPERVRETFEDAYRASWDEGIKGIQDMLGANGFEDFKDAWKGTGEGLLHVANPVNVAPDAINEFKSFVDNPEAALGHKSAVVTQMVPGLILGGEGAAVRAGLPAELVTEGGAPAAVMRGLDPSGGMPWKDFDSQYGSAGARDWPKNDGFPPGYTPQPAHLPAGTIIDRFGAETGSYLAPDGAPFADRALMPESVGSPYHRYMVTGETLPPGLRIVEGPVAPWFGQTPSPGATQYMIVGSDGAAPSVEELIRRGYLIEDGPPLGR